MENKELNITYRPIKELKPYKKNAKKRIPKFVDDCMSLYKVFTSGTVKMSEMVELTEEYAGIKLVQNEQFSMFAEKVGE